MWYLHNNQVSIWAITPKNNTKTHTGRYIKKNYVGDNWMAESFSFAFTCTWRLGFFFIVGSHQLSIQITRPQSAPLKWRLSNCKFLKDVQVCEYGFLFLEFNPRVQLRSWILMKRGGGSFIFYYCIKEISAWEPWRLESVIISERFKDLIRIISGRLWELIKQRLFDMICELLWVTLKRRSFTKN